MARMNAELRMEINLTGFNKWLWYFSRTCKSSFEKNLAQQAKLLVKEALLYTPPMAGGNSFKQGELSAKRRIDTDTQNAFLIFPTRWKLKKDSFFLAYDISPEELRSNVNEHLQWYLSKRGKNRRIPKGLEKRRAIFANDLEEVRKKLKERIGWLASGWAPAAKAFQVNIPEWISRHSGHGAGGIKLVKTDWEISITCYNSRQFSESKQLQNKLADALNNRAKVLQKRTLLALAKKISKSRDVFI